MSDVVESAAPATESAPQAPAVEAGVPPPGSQGAGREYERTQAAVKALANLRAKARGEQAKPEPSAPAPETTTDDTPPEPKEAPAAAPAAQAKQDVADVQDLQRKLEAALADAQRRDRETWELKQAREQLDAKLKLLEERDARLKANPFEALKEISGVSYDQLTKEILQGKYKPPTEAETKLSETDKRLSELQSKLERIEQEKAEVAAREARARDIDYAKTRVTERAESLPFLSTFDWAAQKAVETFYGAKEAGQEADFEAIVSELDKAISNDVRTVLANERALKSLLEDKDIREAITKALGPQVSEQRKASPASRSRAQPSGEGPSTITQQAISAPGAREPQKASDRDRIAAARAAIQALRERGAQT